MALVPVKVFVAQLAAIVKSNTDADAARAAAQSEVDVAQNGVVEALSAALQALQATVFAIPQIDPNLLTGFQSSLDNLAGRQEQFGQAVSTLESFDAAQAQTNESVAAQLTAINDGLAVDDGVA